MSDPSWREARPSRPYGGEPGARPRGRDPGTPGAPRTSAAVGQVPWRDSGRDGGMTRARDAGGGWSDPRGSDARGRDPGWGGHDSDRRDPRGPGGSRRDPGPPAGRSGDPGAGAQTRRMPAQPGPTPSTPPTSPTRTQPAGTRPGLAQPGAVRDGAVRDGGGRDGGGRSAGGPRDYRGRRNSQRPGRRARWGALQGGLGVCIIVASAAIGATATMVTRSVPGVPLGFFVVAGTIAAALASGPGPAG